MAAATFGLAGCSPGVSHTDPSATSTPASESATPTATPTPTASYKPASASGPAENVPVPVLPEVAKTETKEGAEAFAKYWFSVLSYAYETGEVADFEKLEPPSCVACQKVKGVIQDWHSDGRWLVGGKLSTPVASTTFVRGQDGRYQVAVQVRQEPLSYFRPDGTVARTDPQAPDQGNLLILAYENDAWSAVELGSIVG
ncbi:DUF6318 family protein [Arthrobacter sp. CDRTa11]|uniref:DUF6318 family protein n=1 Tax=Arthrobacter sp. CDRTa11 TaxID=2651199 RepID=UPI003A5D1B38